MREVVLIFCLLSGLLLLLLLNVEVRGICLCLDLYLSQPFFLLPLSSTMRTSLALACLSLASLCLAEPGVVSLRTYKNHAKHAEALRKRDAVRASKRDAFPVTLSNFPFIGGGF